MLTEKQIQEAIIGRLTAMSGSCNRGHLDHNDGVLRGLLWAMSGEDPGTYLSTDTARVLLLAGIKHTREGDTVHWEME
jgi:hypothetical protein